METPTINVNGLHEENICPENYPFNILLNIFDNFAFPVHWHHAIEFIYPIDNGYTVNVNDHDYVMNEKDIMIIAGGDIHSFNTVNNPGNRYFIHFDIFKLDVFGKHRNFNPSLLITQLITPRNNNDLHKNIEAHIISIIKEFEQKPFAYDLSINARFLDILVALFRNLSGTELFVPPSNSNKIIQSMERLNYALQYVENNYQSSVTLKAASKAAGFSEYYFSRVFKNLTGQNFNNYVNARRIKRAEKLLVSHDLSIIEIAHRAGFHSLTTFNRIFKKARGCTPMEYKKLQLHSVK
jgi:AraC-like DNA-binding protein